jgi:hypothetical protein
MSWTIIRSHLLEGRWKHKLLLWPNHKIRYFHWKRTDLWGSLLARWTSFRPIWVRSVQPMEWLFKVMVRSTKLDWLHTVLIFHNRVYNYRQIHLDVLPRCSDYFLQRARSCKRHRDAVYKYGYFPIIFHPGFPLRVDCGLNGSAWKEK